MVFSTFGNIRHIKMNHFSQRNLIFDIPRARNCKNDKFVTIGVPEAETNANLIFFTFEIRSPKIPKNAGGSAGDAKRLQLMPKGSNPVPYGALIRKG